MKNINVRMLGNRYIMVFIFFIAYLFVGLSVYKDYGISWDEFFARNRGKMVVDYILKKDNTLATYPLKHYGTTFDMPLYLVERTLNLSEDLRDVFLMRHLATFLLFYISVVFFYILCLYKFKDTYLALLGAGFLVFSPRIFAESFYNPKDIPCMAMFIISMFTLIKYLDSKTVVRAFWHGLSCALLFGIRILGIIVPVFTLCFFIIDLAIYKEERKKKSISFLCYVFFFISFTILFWPILWNNPFSNFIDIFKAASNFKWDGLVFYMGEYIEGKNIPWHYLPIYMGITIPISYLILFVIGLVVSIKKTINSISNNDHYFRDNVIFLIWFFLPFLFVITGKHEIYDGWRHVYFIYPAFIIMALSGLEYIFKTKWQGIYYKTGLTLLAFLFLTDMGNTLKGMILNHPYQNVYYNKLAGKNMVEIKKRFELDYWGLSYRQALEYLLKNDRDAHIKICVANTPGNDNYYILPRKDRERIEYVDEPANAKYFLGNYRGQEGEGDYLYNNEFYSIKVDGAKIMVVYRYPFKISW